MKAIDLLNKLKNMIDANEEISNYNVVFCEIVKHGKPTYHSCNDYSIDHNNKEVNLL